MNKNCFRIIFNKARGLLMAVAETVAGEGKANGAVPAASSSSKPLAVGIKPATFLVWGMLGMVVTTAAYPQIVADPGAPGGQQPTVLAAPNGVPLVNIQTPSAAGVSRNTYRQFDVQQQGAVLNNSRTNIQSQLGGLVQGNPWLAGGSARVILNEVNSSNPSYLRGYVEIAGQRAQLVIANPAGVTCEGCGFVNASRATITTGTPILNGGSLEGYVVRGGAVAVTGNGMDARTADFTDIIARAVQLNAGLWANQLKVVAGPNEVSIDPSSGEHTGATAVAGGGVTPVFAIDVSQLGGMYAGHIALVGSEAGVGVRNAGTLYAGVGDVVITANGQLLNAGQITSVGHIKTDAQTGAQNAGTIYAQGNATINTRGNIDNNGVIAAQGDTTLTATGVSSLINNSKGAVLGAGVQADGSLGASGTLTVSATAGIAAQGQHLSGGDQSFSARAVNLASSESAGRNLSIAASSGDADLSGATVSASQTFAAGASQTLRTDNAKVSANGISVSAKDLSNVQGEILHAGSGNMTLVFAGSLDNSEGRIATNSQNITLAAQALTNVAGKLEHAGTGTMLIQADAVNGQGGQITSNGTLDLTAKGVQFGGANTIAAQLKIAALTLANQGGEILQTGTQDASISVTGTLNNTAGRIATNGSASLSAQSLHNEGGTIQTAGESDLSIALTGELANGNNGQIAAGGDATLDVGSLPNSGGKIMAGGALTATSTAGISNASGLIAATGTTVLQSNSLDNVRGTIVSVNGNLTAATTAMTVNDSGLLQAWGDVSLTGAGLSNGTAPGAAQAGRITGRNVTINTGASGVFQALDNTQGTIAASQSLSVMAGALTNEAGLIQSEGAMVVDTHGKQLDNTNAAGHTSGAGGISSQGTLELATGALNNASGYIGAKAAMNGVTGAVSNNAAGLIVGETAVSFVSTGFNNQGGQVQALGNITLNASGIINNTASLIRSAAAVNLTAEGVVNSATNGSNQGIEGNDVAIAAASVANDAGAIRANHDVVVTAGTSVNNDAGLLSAGNSLTVQDSSADANRTLAVSNAGGTAIGAQSVAISAASLAGNGKVLSKGILDIDLSASFHNTGEITANGDARIHTTGTLTNSGKLQSGARLDVSANALTNSVTGEIAGAVTHVNVTGLLTNRGLIDGQDTQINAATVHNIGTGRIYGDHLGIAAGTVINDVETVNGVTTSATIAARERLDIGVQTMTNREHALIFSAGDMVIGGTLDGNRHVAGQALAVNNASATIEALGNLEMGAAAVNNTNSHFVMTPGAAQTESRHEFMYDAQLGHVNADQVYIYQQRDRSGNYFNATLLSTYARADGEHIYMNMSNCWCLMGTGFSHEWSEYQFQRTTITDTVVSSDPGRILSGGNLSITGTLVNDKSQVIAGSTLGVTGGTVSNLEALGNQTVTDVGQTRFHTYVRGNYHGIDQWYPWAPYTPAALVNTVEVPVSVYLSGSTPTGSGLTVASTSAVAVGANVGAAGVVAANARAVGITQVNANVGAVGAAAGSATLVKTIGFNGGIPSSSLFHLNPNPAGGYLIETDPRFTNYGHWLSSDYMLDALGIDPALIQKRLGDGFYEQRLIREQVAQLTGQRFLGDYTSDDEAYKGLMNGALTQAEALELRPGIALTAQQMAQLTSDIVWLVEQDVTLPDGRTTRALVPQVYVRLKEGDLDGSGTLLAGKAVNLNLTGDLTNSGTIAGRQVVNLTAENVHNLAGRMDGAAVAIAARNDLNNIGGQISAANSLSVVAGRDLNITTTTQGGAKVTGIASYASQGIDRVAGLYVTGDKGLLLASAGRDMNLVAAQVLNAGKDGNTAIAAGRDVNLEVVKAANSEQVTWNANNLRKDAVSQDVGTQIQGAGAVAIIAGRDVNASAATAQAEGVLDVTAGRDINLQRGRQTQDKETATQTTRKGFLSRTTTTTYDRTSETLAIGTSLGGQSVNVRAGNDINVTGSSIIGDRDVTLSAANNVNITAATNTRQSESLDSEKRSGLFGSGGGGIGFTIGTRKQSTDTDTQSTSAAASTVGAVAGNVTIRAGSTYTQTGSDVIAPGSDVDILARDVKITEARETQTSTTQQKFSQSGLTVQLTSPVLSAVQTIASQAQAAGNTGGSRMQALAAANTALAARNAANAIKDGQGSVINGKEGQIATGRDEAGNLTSRDATAADQAGGMNLSISIGGSTSQSNRATQSETARGSSIQAGGSVTIRATGAGEASNILIKGSTVKAGDTVTLDADNKVQLLAARSTASQTSSDKSSSASIGISIGTSGFGVTVSGSAGRGNADGSDVTHTNTQVEANRVNIKSGGDTDIFGAVVKADTVTAKVGGNLNIESLQDTSTYRQSSKSVGGSLTVGAGVSGSFNASKSNINSTYASVTEQSGIRAGDGGFQVEVQGKTDLKGGAITSTQAAIDQGRNEFESKGGVTTSDIHNTASYSAKSTSIGTSLGSGNSPTGQSIPGGSFGAGKDSGKASSTTQSAISGVAGNKEARTGDAETGIKPIFDQQKVNDEVNAQVAITGEFGKNAAKAWADYSKGKLEDLKEQTREAAKTGDSKAAKDLFDEAKKWDEGGEYRIAGHTVLGALAGGAGGAAGALTSAATMPVIAGAIESSDLPDVVKQGLGMVTSATLGGIVGGTAGSATAFNVDTNNRQLHPAEKQTISRLAKDKAVMSCRGDAQCEARSTTYWADLMEKAALSLVDDEAYAQNLIYMAGLAQAGVQQGSEGAMGALQNYLADYQTAQAMMAARAGQVISVNGQVATNQGTAQTWFSASDLQRADPTGNVDFFNPRGSIVPNVEARDADRLEKFNAQSGSAQPVYPVEEILLGGVAGNKLAAAAGKVIGELDLFFAGVIAPTKAGTVNAGKVSSEGLTVKLSVAEQSALRAMDSSPNVQVQGMLREIVSDSYFQRNGYKALDGKCGSGNCFDGVYAKGDWTIVNEVKPMNADGTIKLASENKTTGLPAQESDRWVDDAVRRLRESGDPTLIETADRIAQAKVNKKLIKVLTGIDSNGMVVVKVVDQ